MPYRDYFLPYHTRVRTRVSDAATDEWFLDWLDHRGTNGIHGRPPDIDTPMHRMWVGGKHIDGDPRPAALTADSGPLATFTQNIEFEGELVTRTIKVLLGFLGDELVIHIRGQRHPGGEDWINGEARFGPEAMDKANDMLQDTLGYMAILHAMLGAKGDGNWMIALPDYFESLGAEHDAADQDVHDEVAANGPLPIVPWGPQWEVIRTKKLSQERPEFN